MKASKLLRIRGRVQGVFFREAMKDEARRLGVTGWVRNRKDGSVEALVQGEAGLVEAIIEWASRGPPAARVETLDAEDFNGETILSHFTREETE